MESPGQRIQRLIEERRSWSDADVLRELEALPVLPADVDDTWGFNSPWWETSEQFLAFADLAAERRLRTAIPLLLGRACYGDPGEIMRGLRHALERIVAPDYDALTPLCIDAAASSQPGARLWAVAEL